MCLYRKEKREICCDCFYLKISEQGEGNTEINVKKKLSELEQSCKDKDTEVCENAEYHKYCYLVVHVCVCYLRSLSNIWPYLATNTVENVCFIMYPMQKYYVCNINFCHHRLIQEFNYNPQVCICKQW